MDTHGVYPKAAYTPEVLAASTWNRVKCTPEIPDPHSSGVWSLLCAKVLSEPRNAAPALLGWCSFCDAIGHALATSRPVARPRFRKALISEIGSRITIVALPLIGVLVLNARPFQIGMLVGIGGFASLIFGLAAGLCVDRLRRRAILIVTDLGRAAVLGSIPLAAVFGVLRMPQIYAVWR